MASLQKESSGIETITITTLTEFTSFIETKCLGEYMLFRGQSQDWDLLPKIARITPKKGNSILDMETSMLDDFKRLAKPYLKNIPTNEWEWLGLAQHHGMATRLLDWSTNPLAALWFAVKEQSKKHSGVVWIFDAPEEDILMAKAVPTINPYISSRTKVFQPELSSVRIQSQNGWFTVHKYIKETKKFIPFQKNIRNNKFLKKIIIPSDHFYKLRFQLDRMGVNRLSLFPDLEGAANYSEWLNSFLDDEQNSILKS
jgi:hypothetical protein